jgi:uncharacterized OB-fold protein
MCVAQHRYGPLVGLDEDGFLAIEKFVEERKKQFDADLPRGLRSASAAGWQCPNCGRAHAPDVATCPEMPRGGSLRERLKLASS